MIEVRTFHSLWETADILNELERVRGELATLPMECSTDGDTNKLEQYADELETIRDTCLEMITEITQTNN